jgi:hypothetical protein
MLRKSLRAFSERTYSAQEIITNQNEEKLRRRRDRPGDGREIERFA